METTKNKDIPLKMNKPNTSVLNRKFYIKLNLTGGRGNHKLKEEHTLLDVGVNCTSLLTTRSAMLPSGNRIKTCMGHILIN